MPAVKQKRCIPFIFLFIRRLQAENEELHERVKELSQDLQASHKLVKKLKSLAKALTRIRCA
jgi:uncharacterized coiled-coil DUF342 family protein